MKHLCDKVTQKIWNLPRLTNCLNDSDKNLIFKILAQLMTISMDNLF